MKGDIVEQYRKSRPTKHIKDEVDDHLYDSDEKGAQHEVGSHRQRRSWIVEVWTGAVSAQCIALLQPSTVRRQPEHHDHLSARRDDFIRPPASGT